MDNTVCISKQYIKHQRVPKPDSNTRRVHYTQTHYTQRIHPQLVYVCIYKHTACKHKLYSPKIVDSCQGRIISIGTAVYNICKTYGVYIGIVYMYFIVIREQHDIYSSTNIIIVLYYNTNL